MVKQYNSNFVTNEISPRLYTNKDISEGVYTTGGPEGTLKIDYDDITMRTKLIVTQFGGTFGTYRFDGKSSFNTSWGFTPYWDYKPNNSFHAVSPGVKTSEEIWNSSTIYEIYLKRDIIDGSVANGMREPKLFGCFLGKPAVFSKPETKFYKKLNKSVLNTITVYLEDDKHKENNFSGETLTLTLQMVKVLSCKVSFQKFKNDSYCVGGGHISATKNIFGYITSKGSWVVIGYCSLHSTKKSMTVSDNTIQVDGFGDFFGNLGKKKTYCIKKDGNKRNKKIMKELGKLWKVMLTLVVRLHPEALK